MQEKRLTNRLTNYWRTLPHLNNGLPRIDSVNPSAISDIWPQCGTLLRLRLGEDVYCYEYQKLGDELAKTYGQNLVGRRLNPKMPDFPAASILLKIDELAKQKNPMYDEGQFINTNSRVVKYRSCMLPFSNQPMEVTHILLGLSWREF